MGILSFRGGIHPPDCKYLTKERPIEDMPIPARVVIPLHQHTGATCEPIVQLGDIVREGQKIGDAKPFISAPIHASIPGKVVEIRPHPHPAMARDVLSVVIEKDASAPLIQTATKKEDWLNIPKEEIKDKIREAGIVGLGGAAFPTHVKLSPPPEKKIDTVILNGCECEPYLTTDYRLMLERTDEILEGLKIILKVLGLGRAVIGIESNKPDAIKKMGDACDSSRKTLGLHIEVVALKIKYPQGAEKQLIKAILNREVPSGGLPFDVGVIVQNVGTALAIYEKVVMDKPLIERVITVTGDGIKEPRNLRARIGTPFSEVIGYCGGFNGHILKVIMGGPMMGLAQWTLEVPVVKGTSGILLLKEGNPVRKLRPAPLEKFSNGANQEKEFPCIRCGRCVDVCPMNLLPNRIGDYAEKDLFSDCKGYGVLDCMECGSCAYVCPSRRRLVHLIKYAKSQLTRKT